ncbi:MAG TPA: tetratricopeptide repeat protein [Bryobacteraceae bacterium]|nr:tetratricopeptide repeat protein [Bryobacteraceae bacterium]
MSPSVRRHGAVVFVVCLFLACPFAASCQQEMVRVGGAVMRDSGGPNAGLIVELCDAAGDKVVDRAMVSPSGEFAFEGVPAGRYELRVSGWRGGVLAERPVSASASGAPVEIHLSTPAAGDLGKVTVAQLQHHVPARAAREFAREGRAFEAGDVEGAIGHLRKALEIDPDYMEAHNNLGARYMALHRFEDAAAEFRRATELDPAAEKAFANLAGALLLLGRDAEAEAAARRAVALDGTDSLGRYVLGRVLASENIDGRR